MSEKFKLAYNKTLKLQNVLIKEVIGEDFQDLEKTVAMMENYIKSKGMMPIGPLIQYMTAEVDEDGNIQGRLSLMRQSTGFIHKVESPYGMNSEIKIKNCLYVRFDGEEEKFSLAYNKLQITAYEEDIKLKGNSYTVFIENENDNMLADIFMETV